MPPLTPGEIAKVDPGGRVQIPSDVLKAVSWWSGESVEVSIELTYRGLIRVYPSSAVRAALLQADKTEVPASEAAYIALAVRADRYRFLKLYGPECRLRLTKEICPWLGFALGEPAALYAQAFPYGVEVMTMDYRFERLSDPQAEVLPWTFTPPSK
jgi:hypothetical protein